uniref:Uncharacterized protein n=1 Tax=Otus sunia TaxID=257818 RepID=A0A8C8BCE4_9STRI
PEISAHSSAVSEILFVLFYLLATKTDHPLQEHTSDKYLTSEKWLQKYGLKAQKLTLYDALADCTFPVPHGTKYTPVLDKHVVSKVFDEVKLLCYFSQT